MRYGRYLDRLLHFDLGTSYRNGAPVSTILGQHLPPTLSVLAGGAVLWLIADFLYSVPDPRVQLT